MIRTMLGDCEGDGVGKVGESTTVWVGVRERSTLENGVKKETVYQKVMQAMGSFERGKR